MFDYDYDYFSFMVFAQQKRKSTIGGQDTRHHAALLHVVFISQN